MKKLRLDRHAHCCFTPDGAILLDLRSDRYSVIPEAESRTLALLLGAGASNSDADGDAAESVAGTLRERGLTTCESELGRPFAPLDVELTGRVLLDQVTGSPRVDPLHVWRFLRSCIAVHIALRRRSFQYAVERAKDRKARDHDRARALDLELAKTLVQIARTIRPVFYSAYRQCLYDSFVLADFLAQYALYPTIVVGVTTKPFRAHCWVQHAGVAFNSDQEDVTQYTPILSI